LRHRSACPCLLSPCETDCWETRSCGHRRPTLSRIFMQLGVHS